MRRTPHGCSLHAVVMRATRNSSSERRSAGLPQLHQTRPGLGAGVRSTDGAAALGSVAPRGRARRRHRSRPLPSSDRRVSRAFSIHPHARGHLPRRGRITLEDVPRPQIGDGELLVRMSACGLSGSDLMRWTRMPGHRSAGSRAGRDGCGGRGGRASSRSARGCRASRRPIVGCRLCRAGRHTLCDTFKSTRIDPGGLAEFIRVPADKRPGRRAGAARHDG